jgi:transcriptional regulator
MGKPNDLVQGTLDLLILKVLSLEPKHGWAIAKRIQQISHEQLQVQQGSLYPALYRLEGQRLIKAEWKQSPSGREAKFYALTAAGRKRLDVELENWRRLSTAIDLVTRTA